MAVNKDGAFKLYEGTRLNCALLPAKMLGFVNETNDKALVIRGLDGTLYNFAVGTWLATSLKGAANGLAELGSDGKVPSNQLPSYVDDILEYDNLAAFPVTGETGKIYVAKDTNLTYRWSGSAYVEISASLALGETSSTAYRGDRGKTAYDHSQITGSNPHGATAAQIGGITNTYVVYSNGTGLVGSGKLTWDGTQLGIGVTTAVASPVLRVTQDPGTAGGAEVRVSAAGTGGNDENSGRFVLHSHHRLIGTTDNLFKLQRWSGAAWNTIFQNASGTASDLGLLFKGAVTSESYLSGASLNADKAAGNARDLFFNSSGSARWVFRCNNIAESGSDAGSNLEIRAYSDGSGYIDSPISIVRAASGAITVSRPMTVNAAVSSSTYTATAAAGNFRGLQINNGTSRRWAAGATSEAEIGADAGSNYQIYAYTDAGGGIDSALTITRAAGGTFQINRPTKILNALTLQNLTSNSGKILRLIDANGQVGVAAITDDGTTVTLGRKTTLTAGTTAGASLYIPAKAATPTTPVAGEFNVNASQLINYGLGYLTSRGLSDTFEAGSHIGLTDATAANGWYFQTSAGNLLDVWHTVASTPQRKYQFQANGFKIATGANDSQGSGSYLYLGDSFAAPTKVWALQLGASNTLDFWNYASSAWTKRVSILPSGEIVNDLTAAIKASKTYTGFEDPNGIDVSYNSTNRTITLTHSSGSIVYYYLGAKVTLASPWTSSAHANSDGSWFLYFSDATTQVWSNSTWSFDQIMIAYVYKAGSNIFAIRETHGLSMSPDTHADLHTNVGTYLKSGGLLTVGTYEVGTATDVATTPGVDATTVVDEDLASLITAFDNTVSGVQYTKIYPATASTIGFSTNQATPFTSAGSYIQWYNGTTLTTGATGKFYNVYGIAVPTTSDTGSQAYKWLWLQPQAEFSTEADAKREDFYTLNLGDLTGISPEFLPRVRLTYSAAAGNANTGKVTLTSPTYLTRSRSGGVGSTSLSGVSSDAFGNLTANSFIKSGGTSSQLLLANGGTKPTTDFATAPVYGAAPEVISASGYASPGSTTSETAFVTVATPANLFKSTSRLVVVEVNGYFSCNNSGTNTLRLKVGGQTFFTLTSAVVADGRRFNVKAAFQWFGSNTELTAFVSGSYNSVASGIVPINQDNYLSGLTLDAITNITATAEVVSGNVVTVTTLLVTKY